MRKWKATEMIWCKREGGRTKAHILEGAVVACVSRGFAIPLMMMFSAFLHLGVTSMDVSCPTNRAVDCCTTVCDGRELCLGGAERVRQRQLRGTSRTLPSPFWGCTQLIRARTRLSKPGMFPRWV